jgi:hypothetical protein
MTSQSVSPDIQPIDVYPSDLDGWLERVGQALPVVKRTLEQYGDLTVEEYLATQNQFSEQSFQPREDVAEVLYEHTQGLLGEEVARRTADEFLANPVVLTANHHGVDYFAQSVQGTLLFSWRNINGKPATTIPVLACANVPLDNLTYPRGLILYPENTDSPIKIPLFSNKHRRKMVSTVKGMATGDIELALKNLEKSDVCGDTKQLAKQWIERYYAPVSDGPSYSDQSTIINHTIWADMNPDQSSDLVYLDLEAIASKLLLKDINDLNSLFGRLVFDKNVCRELYRTLSGHKNTWSDKIESDDKYQPVNTGTFLFWGIDQKGKRFPLRYDASTHEIYGEKLRFSLESVSLLEHLSEGVLLPSVFTSFLLISLARGVTLLGGYYQADYLEYFKKGLLSVLNGSACTGVAQLQTIKKSITSGYLSGMQLCVSGKNTYTVCGPVEMLSGQMLTGSKLEHLKKHTVKEAHALSLLDTLWDVEPKTLSIPEVQSQIKKLLTRLANSQSIHHGW